MFWWSSRSEIRARQDEWNLFLDQWNDFLYDYHKDHSVRLIQPRQTPKATLQHGAALVAIFGFGIASFALFKIASHYVYYRSPRLISSAPVQGSGEAEQNQSKFHIQGYFWSRSAELKFRFSKKQLFRGFFLKHLKQGIATVEIHQDRERKTLTLTIPKRLASRIRIEWQETGVEASTTAAIVIGVLPEALDCRTGISLIDQLLAYMEIDHLFDEGVLLPLATVPIPNPSAIDPGDVVAFWEDQPPVAQPVERPPVRPQSATTIPLDPPVRPAAAVPDNDKVDDRLLYIRIPNTGTRITDIPIAATQPATPL